MTATLISLDIQYIKSLAMRNDKQPNGNVKTRIVRARRILKILERDSYRCVECEAAKHLTIDHLVQPKNRSNIHHYRQENCRVLCVNCHIKKNGWIDNE